VIILMFNHLRPPDVASAAADTRERWHILTEFPQLAGHSRMDLARNQTRDGVPVLLESADILGLATIEGDLAPTRYGSAGDVDN